MILVFGLSTDYKTILLTCSVYKNFNKEHMTVKTL